MSEQKVAVVTGGTSGIGRATALALKDAGCTMYELSRRAEGVEGLHHIAADVTREDTVRAAVAEIMAREGRIDILVNNAGFGISGAVEFTDTEDAKALFDVNEDLIGTEIKGHPVLDVKDMDEYIRENQIDIGVIAARRSAAQEIADRMCAAGIRGIWNFVPLDITTSVPIENVHLSESLSTLSYKIEHGLLD